MAYKKPLKIILGIVVFLTLPSLLFFGYLYYQNHQDLPTGQQGSAADKLATKMLMALNYEAYVGTDYIEWTFKNKRHYKWHKADKNCEVYWKDYKVKLNLETPTESKAYVHSFIIQGKLGAELVEEATAYFREDIFWLVAPYQVFEKDVKRTLVTSGKKDALLITYSNNDSYLWQFNDKHVPVACSMWNAKTPIDGLQATWSNWQNTETGMKLPQFHKILFFGMEISDVKTK